MITLHVEYNTHEPVRRQLTFRKRLALALSKMHLINALRRLLPRLTGRFSIG